MSNKLILCVAAGLALSGCQAAKRGSTDVVKINVAPAGAKVTTSLGMTCVSPCQLKVKRRKAFTVTASKAGYKSKTVKVARVLNKKAARRSAVSFVVPGGTALVAADAISGSLYDHHPNPVRIRLKRR